MVICRPREPVSGWDSTTDKS